MTVTKTSSGLTIKALNLSSMCSTHHETFDALPFCSLGLILCLVKSMALNLLWNLAISCLAFASLSVFFHGQEDEVTGGSSGVLGKDSDSFSEKLDVLFVTWDYECMINLLVLGFDRAWSFVGILGTLQGGVASDAHADREGQLIYRF